MDSGDNYPYFTREQAIDMNVAFAHAMIAARDAGLERFTLGPKKDFTGFIPTHFERAVSSTLIRSSGALCAEMGSGEEMPEYAIPRAGPHPGR